MRGHTLFAELFETKKHVDENRKGRSSDLINSRNEFLFYRYYYYGQFFENTLSYKYIIETLAKEVWLSDVTVPQILEDNYERLGQIKKQSPDKRWLREKWPYWVW